MTRQLMFIALIFTLFAQAPKVYAQAMFAGYAQFCGVPVVVTPNPQTASAAMDQAGNPVIYIDPGAMANWTTSRIFTIAHECGHHMRGHSLPQGMWFRNTTFWGTKQQELEADCWAAGQLAGVLATQDLQRMIMQFASQGSMPQGNYPSGMERATVVARCAGIPFSPPATVCATQFGSCPLGVQLQVGTQCFCPSYMGPVGGVAQ